MSAHIRPSHHPGARLATEARTAGAEALAFVIAAIGGDIPLPPTPYDIRYHARMVAREAASAARQAFRRGYPRPSEIRE